MSRAAKTLPAIWRDALREAALEGIRRGRLLHLFLEVRDDLTIELDAAGEAARTLTRWAGASATRLDQPSVLAYLADPRPEDIPGLAREAAGGGAVSPPPGASATAASSVGDAGPERGDPAELLARIAEAVRRSRPGARVVGRAVAFDQRVWVVAGESGDAADRRRGIRLRVEASLGRGGSRSVAVVEAAGRGALDADPGGLAEALVARLESRLDARPTIPGPRRVVLGPGVGGVLVHEIVGHALEADTVLAGGSWLGRREGPVASRELVVVDDPRRGRGAWKHDDEGQPSRPVALVRDGRVAGRLHDLRSAARSREAPSGHGRRSTYREPVRPRMGCTFVAAGRREPAEVLAAAREGVYVRRMEAARADVSSGRAVFRVTDSDRIVDGRIDAPLEPHLLVVDGAEALAAMDHVASDLAFDTCVGSCHRDGQTLVISVGAPTIWIGVAGVG